MILLFRSRLCSNFEFAEFYINSIEFHLYNSNPGLECYENYQYLNITIHHSEGAVTSDFYCDETVVNLSVVATKVDFVLNRDGASGSSRGFYIEIDAANTSYDSTGA